jgi:hypothetical protein
MGFKTFALCSLFALAQAKGGKGGGDSSSGSSGSDSSGSSGSSGSSSNRGQQHVEISGNDWPYRWPGSYYNGSIVSLQSLHLKRFGLTPRFQTLDTSIEYWSDCSQGRGRSWRTSYDGILMLGPGNQTGSFNEDDPQFVLMGWDDNTVPTNNWTDGVYWSNGGPGATRWFSTDVKVMLSRFIHTWQDMTGLTTSSSQRPYDHGWNVNSDPLGNGTNQYAINGTWSGLTMSFQPGDNSNDNWMRPTTTLCNNASVIDQFIMQPWPYSGASKDWPTTQNTTFRGTFSDRAASITWGGNYWAGFNSISYGVPGSKSGYPQGYFSLKFEGLIDERVSDRLVPRVAESAATQNIGGPDWVAVHDRDDNLPNKTISYSAASLSVSGGLWWVSLGITGMMVLVS